MHEDRYHEEIAQHDHTGAPSVIVAPESIDALAHERLYRLALPLLQHDPGAAWLTVGDNGGDAWWLRQHGAAATASCLTTHHLKRFGDLLGGLPILELNAEALAVPDKSFDYVLCKEAFHHFPRPMLGFYEFLRVARKGVLFIEPVEFGSRRPLDIVRMLAKRILRGQTFAEQEFETTGNFIYSISLPETRRALTALQTPWFAFKTMNSFFGLGVHGKPRSDVVASTIFHLGVAAQDAACRIGLMRPALAAVYIPAGSDELPRSALRMAGYRIAEISTNPYRPEPS